MWKMMRALEMGHRLGYHPPRDLRGGNILAHLWTLVLVTVILWVQVFVYYKSDLLFIIHY